MIVNGVSFKLEVFIIIFQLLYCVVRSILCVISLRFSLFYVNLTDGCHEVSIGKCSSTFFFTIYILVLQTLQRI